VGFSIFLLRQLLARKLVGWEAVAFQLPFAYLFAFLPSLVMWSADLLLFENIRASRRILILALVGYGASIAMLLIWAPIRVPLPQLLIFGGIGAAQAAICSWLASM